MIIAETKREKIRTCLIFIIGYPILVWLAYEFLMPIVVYIADLSEQYLSKFPFSLLHFLILTILGLGCFFIFTAGFYIWILSIYEIGSFIWEVAFKKNKIEIR